MDLPKEAWYAIFLNSNYKDLINECKINKRTKNLCNDNRFWKLWLKEKYDLDFGVAEGDWKEIAKKLDRLFDIFKTREICMTKRAVIDIISNEPDIDVIFRNANIMEKNLVSLSLLDIPGIKHTLGNPQLDMIIGDNYENLAPTRVGR